MAATLTLNGATGIQLVGNGQFRIGSTGSFNTKAGATIGTYTLATGTAHQVTAAKDCMIYFIATHAGKLTLAVGATNAPTTKLFGTAATVAAGDPFSVRVPAGWYVKPTLATSAAFSTVTVISC